MAVFFGSGGGFPTWVNANVTLAGHWNGVGTGYYTPAYAGATALTVAVTLQPLGTEFNVVTNGKGWISQQYGGAPAHGYWIKHLGDGAIQCAIFGSNLDNPPRTITTGTGVLVPDVPNRIMMRWQGGASELFTVSVDGVIYSPTPTGYAGGSVPAMSLGPNGWNNPVELGGASAIDEGPVSGIYQQWAIWMDYLPDSDAQNYGSNGNPGLLSKTGLYWVTLAAGSITDRNGVPGADPAGFYKAGFGPIGHLVDGWSGFQYGGTTTTYNYGDGDYQQPFNGVFEHFTEVADLPTGGTATPTLPAPVLHLLSGPEPILDVLGGATIQVGSGAGDLATALGLPDGKQGPTPCLNADGSHKGNTYVCPAGATYTQIVLPTTAGDQTSRTNYTRITSNSPSLPAFGTRVGPSHAGLLFKILNHPTEFTAAVIVPINSGGWRFIGMELTHASVGPSGFGFMFINGSRVCVERSYLHGLPADTQTARAMYINRYWDGGLAEDIQIWDSSLVEVKHDGADAQGIYITQARRVHVENCELNATGQGIMLSDQFSADNCFDITLRRNRFFKPAAWFHWLYGTGLEYQSIGTLNPVWDGHIWVHKAMFEIKSVERCLIEGNTIEQNWAGSGLVFNTQNFGSIDITVQHNTFDSVVAGFTVGSQDSDAVPPRWVGKMPNLRHKWYNNLFTGTRGYFAFHSWLCQDMWFEHNTVVPMTGTDEAGAIMLGLSGAFMSFQIGSADPSNFARHTMKRNVLGPAYPTDAAPFINASTPGDPAAITFFNAIGDRTWDENAMYGYYSRASVVAPSGAGTFAPVSGFVMYPNASAAGIDPITGMLTSTSPLRVGQLGYFGSDNKSIGVDFDALNAVQSNVPTPPVADFTATQQLNSLTVQFQDTSV